MPLHLKPFDKKSILDDDVVASAVAPFVSRTCSAGLSISLLLSKICQLSPPVSALFVITNAGRKPV